MNLDLEIDLQPRIWLAALLSKDTSISKKEGRDDEITDFTAHPQDGLSPHIADHHDDGTPAGWRPRRAASPVGGVLYELQAGDGLQQQDD